MMNIFNTQAYYSQINNSFAIFKRDSQCQVFFFCFYFTDFGCHYILSTASPCILPPEQEGFTHVQGLSADGVPSSWHGGGGGVLSVVCTWGIGKNALRHSKWNRCWRVVVAFSGWSRERIDIYRKQLVYLHGTWVLQKPCYVFGFVARHRTVRGMICFFCVV